MGNATVFFRVFDIAFFAPGLVILVPLWRWWDLDLGRGGSASVLDAAVGAALWFLVAYGVGLVVQGLSRIVLAFTGKALPDPDDDPIWLSTLTLAKREELLLYFWYMRATCLNVAIATPIAVEALVNTVAFGRFLQPVVVLALMLFVFLAFAAGAWLEGGLDLVLVWRALADPVPSPSPPQGERVGVNPVR